MKKLIILPAILGLILLPASVYSEDNIPVKESQDTSIELQNKKELRQKRREIARQQAQLQAQIEYLERMARIQQYYMMQGMIYRPYVPFPQRQGGFGISQQIGNIKHNFNSNGYSTEQTIGNKTFTNGAK